MKRSPAASTLPLFPTDRAPQMPDGYYSSGPNPNLRRFVEEHATRYDVETDSYHVPPFAESIDTTKATPIYHMHTYWSKKPPSAIRRYIRHYTNANELVLDPLCGSGTTALAALMEGRATIAMDVSPAATFIAKHYCSLMDIGELQCAFEQLQANVEEEMRWLYETRCDRCDGRATTAYTVYSYVFQCPRCLAKVPLFDCLELSTESATDGPETISVCPYCYERGSVEKINTRSERFGQVPVLVSYLCEEGCRPQRSERHHNDSDPKKRAFFQLYDLGKLQEIEARPIPHWYPPHRMMNVESDTEPWGDKWRAGTSSFRTVAELFTKRNLWALAACKEEIDKIHNIDLRILLSWTVLKCSKMMRYCSDHGGRITSGTYYIPQISRDSHVPSYLAEAFGDLQPHHIAKGEALAGKTELPVVISTQDARHLDAIPDDSIDYVFTDPPYAGKVQYGEMNFIWEAWLGFDTRWHEQEIIVNETRNKTDTDWAEMMHEAMSECYRVLKPGRWISLCYHDTSEGTWQAVQDLMAEIGFIPEQIESALYIDTTQKTLNQMFADKVTRRDLVVNFRKPKRSEIATHLALSEDEDPTTFVEKARVILRDALDVHPGSSADRLYDELVSRMIRKGQFERHDFDALLRSVAEDPRRDNHWYLLETADQADAAESARETSAAAHLEAFMARYRAERPEEAGVHYSDLFEQYLPVKDKPRRLLVDWLPEFFFKTPEGTWRPPADDEERAQKETLRTSGTLRRIKRFARALSEGVPPADRDRPPNTATAADWLRQCRRAGLYELGRALYEKGGFRFDELGDAGQLEVEEDYQTCVRRS